MPKPKGITIAVSEARMDALVSCFRLSFTPADRADLLLLIQQASALLAKSEREAANARKDTR